MTFDTPGRSWEYAIWEMPGGRATSMSRSERSSEIITNEAMQVINPVQIGASQLEAQRIPFGGPNYYKPSIAMLDDGELLMTIAGPREYVYYDRPLHLQTHLERAWLYRSRDGGRTWSEPEELPTHSSKEAHLTVLKDGTILMNATVIRCCSVRKTAARHGRSGMF